MHGKFIAFSAVKDLRFYFPFVGRDRLQKLGKVLFSERPGVQPQHLFTDGFLKRFGRLLFFGRYKFGEMIQNNAGQFFCGCVDLTRKPYDTVMPQIRFDLLIDPRESNAFHTSVKIFHRDKAMIVPPFVLIFLTAATMPPILTWSPVLNC